MLDIGCAAASSAKPWPSAAPTSPASTWAKRRSRWRACTSWNPASPSTTGRSPPSRWPRKCPGNSDVVTCLEMLEHVPDPASVIRACHRLVKPGGQVFLSTINRNPKAYLFAVIGAEYILQLLPRGTHDFRKFIRPSELGAWSREAGLEVKDIIGLTYNPLTKHYKPANDVDVNYMVQTQREA
ncbi:bifunctional 2-polyprenyl-6-hydroxyphenol methylase/3-demethylubiquinol 3-O-methyltransferase UbiG [Pseudomonas aeruginosa]|nr:bifunctional 2-polyprenyl-6-hydroxyphenol methylase/3-demethylubiquinol 3-O-methyltransferase UbiG [Pseudomonas aeruginosa]